MMDAGVELDLIRANEGRTEERSARAYVSRSSKPDPKRRTAPSLPGYRHDDRDELVQVLVVVGSIEVQHVQQQLSSCSRCRALQARLLAELGPPSRSARVEQGADQHRRPDQTWVESEEADRERTSPGNSRASVWMMKREKEERASSTSQPHEVEFAPARQTGVTLLFSFFIVRVFRKRQELCHKKRRPS